MVPYSRAITNFLIGPNSGTTLTCTDKEPYGKKKSRANNANMIDHGRNQAHFLGTWKMERGAEDPNKLT